MHEIGYDAVLVVSFGGPEQPADVEPFLANVTRGREVLAERLAQVAAQYDHVGGRSPINDQNRALVAALHAELAAHDLPLPVYWGNRNWHPFLADTLAGMADDGIGSAVVILTSPFSSYSSCRQYREDLAGAQALVGARAPRLAKVRHYWNHPGFLAPVLDRVREAMGGFPVERRGDVALAFTAHSLPLSMARVSGPASGRPDDGAYVAQLREAASLVAAGLDGPHAWVLAFQSRSGPPSRPWLEPDIGDQLETWYAEGVRDVVVVPIGFVSDHMEVRYDLDVRAQERVAALPGMTAVRAETVGTDPRFVAMLRELIVERALDSGDVAERPSWGPSGPSWHTCPVDCCLSTG